MYLEEESGLRCGTIIAILAVTGAVILGYNMWLAWSGETDPAEYASLICLSVLSFLVVVVIKVDRATRRTSAERQRMRDALRESSFTRPDNWPRGRYKDGSIG